MTDSPSFGEELRRLRNERELSLRGLAELSNYSHSYIQALEVGEREPNATLARRLDNALDAGGRLRRIVEPDRVSAPEEETHIGLQLAKSNGTPLGPDDVERLHATVRHLVALDTLHGSEGLHAHAARAFHVAQDKLSRVGVRKQDRADLHAALAEVGEVAAWLAYDSEHQDASRHLATAALLIAERAGDTDMQRFLFSHLSMQATYLGRGAEGLDLADRVIAARPKSRRVVGMMRVRRARALGQLGDTSRALSELRRARAELDGGVGPKDPSWTWWLHTAELAVHEARIKAGSGDARGAALSSEQSVLALPPGQGRDHALFRAWLVSDLVDVGAWHEADWVAEQLAGRASTVGSARVPRILSAAERRAGRAGAPSWLWDSIREAVKASTPS